MFGFRTKSGSVYEVDTVNNTVHGEKIGTLAFTSCDCMVRGAGVFNLVDGRVLRTSTIEKYTYAF